MIVLDTSVLSAMVRRRRRGPAEEAIADHLDRLVPSASTRVVVPGVAYQELLSGIRGSAQFARVERAVSGFTILLASLDDHRSAALLHSRCAAAGVAAKQLDCLIAATTLNQTGRLWTLDLSDFEPMVDLCGLVLYGIPSA